MSIWYLQICMTAIWSCPSRHNVPEDRDEIFREFPNVFGNVDDILVIWYDDDGNDHDRTL